MYLAVQPRQRQPECGVPAPQHQRQDAQRQLFPAAGRAWARCEPSIIRGSSSYNSLQVTVRRNFTRRLSYGLAYTWSKTMSAFGSTAAGYPYTNTQSPYFPDKFRNYGPSYQPTPHVLVVNYIYDVPNLGQKFNLKPLGWVTDHWTISGITQMAQQYPGRRPRHLLLRDHLHQPANELDRRLRRRQDARRRQPAASLRPGVVRRQHAAGAGPRRQCQRHARQSASQRERLRDSEPVQLDARARRRSRASDNPCRASATPAPAA